MSRERMIKIIPRQDLGPGVCDLDEALIESGELTEKTIIENVPRFVAQRAALAEMDEDSDSVVIDYSNPNDVVVRSKNPQARKKVFERVCGFTTQVREE